jgi:hypothetical protein
MAKLLTTLQVRNIMRANGVNGNMMYTNKTTGHTGNQRRVKCYYRGNDKALAALRAACGAENVTLTQEPEAWHRSFGAGITVKCVLA